MNADTYDANSHSMGHCGWTTERVGQPSCSIAFTRLAPSLKCKPAMFVPAPAGRCRVSCRT